MVQTVTPNLQFLLGKSLNALMLDPVERDLEHAQRMNDLITWGTEQFGEGFANRLQRDLGLRHVDILFLKPSEDLGAIAAHVFRAKPPKVSADLRWLLNQAADQANRGEADLLSYLLFDQAYTAPLEQLGWEDAQRCEEQLARLYGEDC